MNLTRSDKDPVKKILWREDTAKRESGGFLLTKTTLASNAKYLKKGAVLSVNRSTRAAVLVKTAKVLTGSTTTAIRVAKGSLFVAGQHIMRAVGSLAVTISSITTTNDAYDVLNLGAALTGVAAGQVIVESAAAGSSAGAFVGTPNGLLSDTVQLENRTSVSVSNVITALEISRNNLDYGVSSDIETSLGDRFLFI